MTAIHTESPSVKKSPRQLQRNHHKQHPHNSPSNPQIPLQQPPPLSNPPRPFHHIHTLNLEPPRHRLLRKLSHNSLPSPSSHLRIHSPRKHTPQHRRPLFRWPQEPREIIFYCLEGSASRGSEDGDGVELCFEGDDAKVFICRGVD